MNPDDGQPPAVIGTCTRPACVQHGQPCEPERSCCGQCVESDAGELVCSDGSCLPSGYICTPGGNECCGFCETASGVCKDSCSAPKEPCTGPDECCSGRCEANGSTMGDTVCGCYENGFGCKEHGECCTGFCIDDKCGDCRTGGTCTDATAGECCRGCARNPNNADMEQECCGSVICHNPCVQGPPLAPTCNAASMCIAAVCDAEPSCCCHWWTASCTNLIAELCGIQCAEDGVDIETPQMPGGNP